MFKIGEPVFYVCIWKTVENQILTKFDTTWKTLVCTFQPTSISIVIKCLGICSINLVLRKRSR